MAGNYYNNQVDETRTVQIIASFLNTANNQSRDRLSLVLTLPFSRDFDRLVFSR